MTEKVRAAVQTGPREVGIQHFARPAIGPDEGLLRVEANGICGSDVETYRGHLMAGRLPMVPGHEPLGIIEEVGDQAAERWGVAVGDRVAVEILVPCRSCPDCLGGRYMSCPNRTISHGATPTTVEPSLFGGFAEHLYLSPNAIVHPVPKDLPAEVAVMFNPLGAGVRWAYHLGEVQLGDTVLVLGAGQRGLMSVIASRAVGAGTIIVTGLASDAHKLELAEHFGADHTIVVDEEDTVERVLALTDGRGVDVVLELTPMAAEPVTHALECVRHGGRVVLAGLKGGREVPVVTDRIINRAATVVGAFGVDGRAYREAIEILSSGRFDLERMHTHSFGLDDVETALRVAGGEVDGEQAVHVSVHPHGP